MKAVGLFWLSLKLIFIVVQCNVGFAQTVTTFAGSGVPGYLNGLGTAASFNSPYGICIHPSGAFFVTDYYNHVIRKITPDGTVTTFAGTGVSGYANGIGTSAAFSYPAGICLDDDGNFYVADQGNHRIRKITESGVVTTIAGIGAPGFVEGWALTANVSSPISVCVDSTGRVFYTEQTNLIKVIDGGYVYTFAGNNLAGWADGVGTAAFFNSPAGLSLTNSGDILVADLNNQRIRLLELDGTVTTIAGNGGMGSFNGTAMNSTFTNPVFALMDALGNIYISENGADLIRKIGLDNNVQTYAGGGAGVYVDGPASMAAFYDPLGMCLDGGGNLYVADFHNNVIRKIIPPLPGSALNFDGIDDIVIADPNPLFNDLGTGEFTLEAWVYPTELSGEQTVICKEGNYALRLSNGFIRAEVFPNAGSGGSYYHSTTVTPISLNQWTHIAAVWDGVAYSIYTNGILSSPPLNSGTATLSGNFCVGGSSYYGQYFQGHVDEVRLWNRALCQDEILYNMNCEIATGSNGLIAVYHFNQGIDGANNSSVNTVLDASGNSLNASTDFFSLSGTVSNWIASGALITGISCTSFIDDFTASVQTQTAVSCFGDSDGSAVIQSIGGVSYSWSPIGGNNNSATGLPVGDYICTVTSACGGVINVPVTITGPAPINSSITLTGITLSSNQVGASYQWLDCDNGYIPIPGENAQQFSPDSNGNYAVEVTVGSCTETSSCVNINNVGFDHQLENLVTIYPNPSGGIFMISLGNISEKSLAIKITDVLGNTILDIQMESNINIDGFSWGSGIYYLQIIDQDRIITKEILIN